MPSGRRSHAGARLRETALAPKLSSRGCRTHHVADASSPHFRIAPGRGIRTTLGGDAERFAARSGSSGRPRRAHHSWGLMRRSAGFRAKPLQALDHARHLELAQRLSRDGAFWLLQLPAQARANLAHPRRVPAAPERCETRRAESPPLHAPCAPRRRALRSHDSR
eukprot:CAMPEP_0176203828 /NCGR_PEP_ID=MMETSP0121_2-20121125/10778_1 /TAXON_ID=160619 /ORGANISM="Kryptoperidinium foliaceum, Strain CCMP 1326" /LENGTH=164 /DNA_ID=CAMNT_0017542739 /DNA_START=189 /DNA_END=680 /DNA_ORIENTATION=+